MAVIVADSVSRSYGETVALDGVSLSIEHGEVFALVGPNGAGKTTLVRALTGTTTVEGTVELFDTSPHEVDPERIGLLPQEFSPPDRLTPRELLAYYGGLYDQRRETEQLLEEVGVADAADTYYENLSGGQKRRVCVATALVNDPDLLIIDEPTTGIDPAGRRRVWGLLESLAAAGTTILLTTHYMAEAERLADRVGLLAAGSLVATDRPATLIEQHGSETLLAIEGEFEAGITDTLGYDATLSEGELTIRDISPAEIGQIVETLDAHDSSYESITWRKPDLEDVYLDLADTDTDGAADRLAPVQPGGESR